MANQSHDPKSSPTGRLDEYIKSFEARYGTVPIESQLNDSLGSISSISLASDRRSRDPLGAFHATLGADGGVSAVSAVPSLGASTSRFPGEPITGGASSGAGHFKFHFSLGPHSTTRHAFGTSCDATSTHATGLLISATSEHGTYGTHDEFMKSPMRPVLCSAEIRSAEMRVPAWKPCAKPERARASSNPPELKLLGPRSEMRHAGHGLRLNRLQSFARPLPAPRGAPPINFAAGTVACNSESFRSSLREVLHAPRLPMSLEMPRSCEDEVNCQSPVRIPQPSKLLRSSDRSVNVSSEALQTMQTVQTVQTESFKTFEGASREAAVQTEEAQPQCQSPETHDFSSPLRLVTLETERTRRSSQFSPHLAQSPEFGRLGPSRPQGTTQPGEKFVASDGELKRRLQNALARSLHHVMNLQALTVQ